jgi:hypothetical protein
MNTNQSNFCFSKFVSIGVYSWLTFWLRRSHAVPAAILLMAVSAGLAQSGSASLHGWVAFENVAYLDKQPRAKVVLQHDPLGSGPAYSTETDEHGFFEFPHTSLGRFKLEITAKGFQPYSADVYIPSDFAGNWAVQLKAETAKRP